MTWQPGSRDHDMALGVGVGLLAISVLGGCRKLSDASDAPSVQPDGVATASWLVARSRVDGPESGRMAAGAMEGVLTTSLAEDKQDFDIRRAAAFMVERYGRIAAARAARRACVLLLAGYGRAAAFLDPVLGESTNQSEWDPNLGRWVLRAQNTVDD